MNWDKIKYFYYAAEYLSFTKAADFLHTSQPAISNHIKNLEDLLSVSLFKRTSNGLILTNKGEELFKSARMMYEAYEEFNSHSNLNHHSSNGELIISTSMEMVLTWLPSYLKEFLQVFPDIKLNIRSDQNESAIEANEIRLTSCTADQANLIHRYLTTFHINFYASKEYLNKFGKPKNVEDLAKHRLLINNNLLPTKKNGDLDSNSHTNENYREPFLKINFSMLLFKLACEGLGIVELPEEYPDIENSNLVKLFPSSNREIKLYYTYLKSQRNNKKIIAFRGFLEQKLLKQ